MSNEMIVHFFSEIKADLKLIHDQTKTTNGRVSSLEKWKERVTGAAAIITLVVVPIFLYMVYAFVKG